MKPVSIVFLKFVDTIDAILRVVSNFPRHYLFLVQHLHRYISSMVFNSLRVIFKRLLRHTKRTIVCPHNILFKITPVRCKVLPSVFAEMYILLYEKLTFSFLISYLCTIRISRNLLSTLYILLLYILHPLFHIYWFTS